MNASDKNNDFAGCSFKDIIYTAKNVQRFKFERSEHQALIKELAFRLQTLKDAIDRF